MQTLYVMRKMNRIKFWLKNCPDCGALVDAIGFNRNVSLKESFVKCHKCGAELKSVLSPTNFSKKMFKIYFPVAIIILGASVYFEKPYSDVLFVSWFLFTAVLIISLFNSFTLEKK